MTGVPVLLAAALAPAADGGQTAPVLIAGLLAFGALFAVNSAIHSYLIVRFAEHDGVSLDVGFYYMSNAAGRLLGTVLSGAIYQNWGLAPCLVASSVMLLLATLASARLERLQPASASAA